MHLYRCTIKPVNQANQKLKRKVSYDALQTVGEAPSVGRKAYQSFSSESSANRSALRDIRRSQLARSASANFLSTVHSQLGVFPGNGKR